ncbi:hypothetical protein [Saccharomonospora viridis]|jgi:hypothetical protein|nr:hypothetical protein [Saccharomonospora viridis]
MPNCAPKPARIATVQVLLAPVGTLFCEHWQRIDRLASPLYYPATLARNR